MSKERPVYVISVAAELVSMHPQTLRLYERKGLVRPKRSAGKTRLYSERDIERLREIRRLTQELGVNLAGVEEIMRLKEELERLKRRYSARRRELEARYGPRYREALKAPALPPPSEPPRKERPVYVISVAAELVSMHPQTLRLYERKGLVRPKRSAGKTRLYSERDIERLREIRRLTQELGVNLAGVEEIMRLKEELERLEARYRLEIEYLAELLARQEA